MKNNLRSCCALLLGLLISGAPVAALERPLRDDENPGVRSRSHGLVTFSQDGDRAVFRYRNPSSARELTGSVDPPNHRFEIEGLSIQLLGNIALADWNGHQAIAAIDPERSAFASGAVEVMALLADWREAVGSDDIEAFRNDAIRQANLERQIALKKPAPRGCTWDVIVLVADFVLIDAACGSGALPACIAAYIIFLDQLAKANDSCGWSK